MRTRKKESPLLATFDAETDPFDGHSLIEPFCFGVAWRDEGVKKYVDFWGDDCALDFVTWLGDQPPMLLYAHNGGKFDFLFLLDHLENPFIIGSRIVKANIGHHQIRDSYSIIPIKLSDFKKDEIDYALFTKEKREDNRADILQYLASDCEYLLELVTDFRAQFGDKLTIASTALTELEKLHPIVHMPKRHDTVFRPYYLGGRVEFFESGKLTGDFKVYDVNSMYPHVMSEFDHPAGDWSFTRSLDLALSYPVSFIDCDVEYANGFGVRQKSGLYWGNTSGPMLICSHELIPALARNEIKIINVRGCMYFKETIRFTNFVTTWMDKKLKAEANGDIAGRLFAKLIANSAYGKTAQNPENFKEYCIVKSGNDVPGDAWGLYDDFGTGTIYRRDNPRPHGYINVAIGASITSASRSILATALAASTRPIYCDTDSIICESLDLDLHPTRIGAWKTEAEGDTCFIAGKKLYALYDKNKCVKKASKGVRLSADEISRVAMGETIIYSPEFPTMKLSSQIYTKRTIVSRV